MWDERYDREAYVYGTEPNGFLAAVASRLPEAARVLMLCDGEGRNGVYLSTLGHDVTSVDSSSVGLQKAQKLAAEKGVAITAVHADLAHFEIEPESWDAIVAIYAHLPPALRKSVHGACVQGLKPGGVFVLEAYTPEQLNYNTGGPQSVDMMMTLGGLREELNGLVFEHGEELVREVREGTHHFGQGAVVQVVAVKA